MNKFRLYLVQVNGRYGVQAYLPYSVGMLWAYAKQFEEITESYDLCGFLYAKDSIRDAMDSLDEPDLVAFSSYIWNWEWNKSLASAIKERWPNCVTLAGGVHVWEESPRTLAENPQFDFAIYGEGEGAFADFLIEHSRCGGYERIGSLVWRDGNEIKVNPRRPLVDVAKLRSPYLDGVFDDLLPMEQSWAGSSETNRGCPYRCSFCAWGNSVLDKLRIHPDANVFGDLEWFSRNKISYVENCDANWMIVNRDMEYIRRMVELKRSTGYPERFRAAWAKNSNEKVWEAANVLHEADMLKAVTLAMQSMNDGVLENIQRKNIKFDKFGELVERYNRAGIPTYTELILGLAGETFEMHLDGIERVIQAGQHSGLFIYMNIMLPNTEQAHAEYIKRFGLKTCDMQAMLLHGTPEPGIVRERQLTIVGTAAMPHEDWKQAWLFDRTIECFHCLGLLQNVAITFCERFSYSYVDFYRNFLDWAEDSPYTIAGRQVSYWKYLLDCALTGASWDCVDNRFGTVSWPPEEFAFLRICTKLEEFYDELEAYFTEELVDAQRGLIVGPERGKEADWAKTAVWYGRKGRRQYLKKGAKA